MLLLYAVSVVLVLAYSTPVGDTTVRQVIPLQQFQRPNSHLAMNNVLKGVSETANGGSGKGGNNNNNHNEMGTDRGSNTHGGKKGEEGLEERARRFVWRQRVRAMRHADYMRIETLHFLKLLSTSIPRLRLVWRGEDYCAWEGITCMALRYPIDTLIDMPRILAKSQKEGTGGMVGEIRKGSDGVRLLRNIDEDPVFTVVRVQLRGMNLFGILRGLRPIDASQHVSPLLSSAAATAIMETRYTQARREEYRQRLTITSPREPQYWPWEASDMQRHAKKMNGTYEMVRYTVRRILRRLELRGERANHPDLQGFALFTGHVVSTTKGGNGVGGSSPAFHATSSPMSSSLSSSSSSSSSSSFSSSSSSYFSSSSSSSSASSAQQLVYGAGGNSRVFHETLLPQLTRQDIAQTVFGEIEPRLVGVIRFDISYNPGITVAEKLHWTFPYMQTFNIFGTTVQPAFNNNNKNHNKNHNNNDNMVRNDNER
ncbi:hypothetical protein MOQ_000765 [Trypanosoma cruzi marinkellei]|uniref:Uncharacterized protein n=1 Tax=Trypanosoma cruzi marinkellei TaxID=85056 RepID=K2NMI2_TRYCR|nr:hypothetical protein MOQ_000765 [Trypanosoma cruzi marinkellei]